jgi:alpha-D-ribose 1-methylphosphonate 5-triphosphate synthase subunit PhnG
MACPPNLAHPTNLRLVSIQKHTIERSPVSITQPADHHPDHTDPRPLPPHHLSILSRTPPDDLKALADQVLGAVDEVAVLVNRTGLVMVPYRDSAKGTRFHLGEVLVSESQVRIATAAGQPVEGYGMCLGRDLEQSMALAVLDAALAAGVQREAILAFVAEHAAIQAAADESLLRSVAATRVEMETF